jgi:diacylglycerol kinase family enzyme
MFMRGMGRLRMLYFLPIVMKANHLKHEKYFEENTARKIRIEADQDLVIHADGEIFSSWETNVRKIEVSIEPAALKVLCNR